MLRILILSSLITICLNHKLEAQQSLRGRFGFGIGYQTGVEFLDFQTLNKNFLKQDEKGLTNNLVLKGFTSYLYFLVLPDTRLTLNLMGGQKEVQSSVGRNLFYEKSLWGVGVEYTISVWHFNVSSGFITGIIYDFVELLSYDGTKNLNDIISKFNSQNFSSNSINFENKSYHLTPVLNIEYSLNRFIALRVNYLYQFRLSSDWKFLRKYSLENFPKNLVSHSHNLNLGFLFGFMSK